jgi:hypothetical protein
MIAPWDWSQPVLPGNGFVAIRLTGGISGMRNRVRTSAQRYEPDGACLFAADPSVSSQDQAIFWAPEVLPSVISIVRFTAATDANAVGLADLSVSDIRQATDGWHAVLRINSCEHRFWLREPLVAGSPYAAELPLDNDFEIRAHAARRLWLALNNRPAGPPFPELSLQRRQRLALTLRALDARVEGNSYRTIAEGLFGAKRITERAWKTHDLRNRTIRLVQSGFALMRGGYRALLRQTRRKQ